MSKAPSNLERYMNIVSSPQDQLVAKNPVIQVAAVAVAAPVIIEAASTAIVSTSTATTFSLGAAGFVEGTIKQYGGPDIEMSESMLNNPASNLGMNAAILFWGASTITNKNPLPSYP